MAVVYVHKRKSDNKVFYVGIGLNEKRAYDFRRRNAVWKGYAAKHPFYVEIIAKDLSWEDACKLEVQLVTQYGRKDTKTGHLLNQTDGGNGSIGVIRPTGPDSHMFGKKGKDHPAYGKGLKGAAHPQFGKSGALSKTSKAVLQINPRTMEVVGKFGSTREASRMTGILQGEISKCCNGIVPLRGGFIWKFAEN
jgi:hypothetical protein